MTIRDTSVIDLIRALQARSPTPGGGAAAAVAAALGCAAGAMSARYTTGPKWGDLSTQSQALAETLDAAARQCLAWADQDAQAYEALTAARRGKDAEVIAHTQERALGIPCDLLAACAVHAVSLRAFLDLSNPHLVSDVKVAIHLLCGAGRAAWQTLLVNQPTLELQRVAGSHLSALSGAESAALGAMATGSGP
jgi:formiminotetrahydrofolate cyclodeaminase